MTVSKIASIDALILAAEKATEGALTALREDDGEERFRTLADNIAQLAWSADESGGDRLVQPALVRLHGDDASTRCRDGDGRIWFIPIMRSGSWRTSPVL